MKTKIPCSLLALILLTGCSKDKETPPSEYTILEFNSSTPVEGARVDAYKCLERDWALGSCTKEAFAYTTTSNAKGIVSFPAADEIAIIKVSKTGYWSRDNYFSAFLSNTTLLEPIATLKVHFIKTNTYAPNNKLHVMSNSGACWQCKIDDITLGQPLDTTIYLKGLGNSENLVESFMWDGTTRKDNASANPRINRFDTAQFEIRY